MRRVTVGLFGRQARMIEKNLSITLFIAGDVFGAPRDKFGEFVPIRHGGVLPERKAGGNSGFRRVVVQFGNQESRNPRAPGPAAAKVFLVFRR